jgi:hypothetical protein
MGCHGYDLAIFGRFRTTSRESAFDEVLGATGERGEAEGLEPVIDAGLVSYFLALAIS